MPLSQITPVNATQLTPLLSLRRGWMTQVVWSPDGTRLAVAHGEGIQLYSLDLSIRKFDGGQALIGHSEPVRAVAYSPDGTRLASAGDDGTVRIWSAITGTLEKVFEPKAGAIQSVVFSPDGTRIAFGGHDKSVRVWELAAHGERVTLEGHTEGVQTVTFYPLGYMVASGGWDGTVRFWLWQLDYHRERVKIFTRHEGRVNQIAFSADGTYMASASRNGEMQVWNLTENELMGSTQIANQHGVDALAFSPDGTLLAAASRDMKLNFWQMGASFEAGPVATLEGHRKPVLSVAYHPRGELLATAGGDHTLKIWGIPTG